METEDTGNHLFTSEIEIVTCTNCESVEFYLDMSEWDSIYISSNERMSLTRNWTNSNSYMEDVAATQQYFRYLLPDPPMSGYVQYFVQYPFIVHMYSYKQMWKSK